MLISSHGTVAIPIAVEYPSEITEMLEAQYMSGIVIPILFGSATLFLAVLVLWAQVKMTMMLLLMLMLTLISISILNCTCQILILMQMQMLMCDVDAICRVCFGLRTMKV